MHAYRVPSLLMPHRVADNVRAEMARRRISQKQLQEDLGWGRMFLGRRLSGNTDFTIGQLTAVADYLGVPITDLLNGKAAS